MIWQAWKPFSNYDLTISIRVDQAKKSPKAIFLKKGTKNVRCMKICRFCPMTQLGGKRCKICTLLLKNEKKHLFRSPKTRFVKSKIREKYQGIGMNFTLVFVYWQSNSPNLLQNLYLTTFNAQHISRIWWWYDNFIIILLTV